MSSMLIRFAPPAVLRISKRIAPDELIVNETEMSLVEEVVTVEPTFDHVEPLSEDFHNSQLLEPSAPKIACLIDTVPALAALKFIRTEPMLRTRAEYAPFLMSLVVFPVSASFKYQLPEPSVTFDAA